MNAKKSPSENAAPAARVTLRKKAPFHCRRIGLDGNMSCLVVLTDSDGDMCQRCAAEVKASREKFFSAPVVPAIPVTTATEPDRPVRRIWPD